MNENTIAINFCDFIKRKTYNRFLLLLFFTPFLANILFSHYKFNIIQPIKNVVVFLAQSICSGQMETYFES